VIYLPVFEGRLSDGSIPEKQAVRLLAPRLSEALPIPIKDGWSEVPWKVGVEQDLIDEFAYSGDFLACFGVNTSEIGWIEIIARLVKEGKARID